MKTLGLFASLTAALLAGALGIPQQGVTIQGSVDAIGSNERLAKVTVELRDASAPTAPPYVTTTEQDGSFVFHNIPAGQYSLTARRNGLLPAEYGQRRRGGPGEILAVGPAQTPLLIQISLTPAAVISGRIHDTNGRPAANVFVSAREVSYQGGSRSLRSVRTAISNDLGDYRIFGLPSGIYYITATASDGAPRNFSYGPDRISDVFARMRTDNEPLPASAPIPVNVTYPDKTDPFLGSPIDVRAGADIRNVNFVVGDFERTTRLRVTFINHETRQASPITMAMLAAVNGTVNRAIPGSQTVTSFDVGFVAAGAYMLSADASGLSGRHFFEVNGEDTREISVTLQPGFAVPVKMTVEGHSTAEAGITNTNVELRLDFPINVPGSNYSSSPRPDGSLIFERVLPGTYTISVLPIQFQRQVTQRPPAALQNAYVKSVRFGSEEGLSGKLHIDNPPNDPIEIVIATTAATLDGRVVGMHPGQEVAGLTVALIPDIRNRPEFFKSATTDSRGAFRFERIPPGGYKVFAWEFVADGAWRIPEFLATDEARGIPIELADNARKTIDVPISPAR